MGRVGCKLLIVVGLVLQTTGGAGATRPQVYVPAKDSGWKVVRRVGRTYSLRQRQQFTAEILHLRREMPDLSPLEVICVELPYFRSASSRRQALKRFNTEAVMREFLRQHRIWDKQFRRGETLLILGSDNGEWFSKGGATQVAQMLKPERKANRPPAR